MKISSLLKTLLNEKNRSWGYRPWRRKTDLFDFVASVKHGVKVTTDKSKSIKVTIYGITDAPNIEDVKIDYEV